MKKRLILIADGIENSVFIGQVIQPLLNSIANKSISSATIISFEQNIPAAMVIQKIKEHIGTAPITLQILPRKRFLYISDLHSCIQATYSLLAQQSFDEIVARGPLAGHIAQNVTDSIPCTIQARGLLAEEYRYSNKSAPFYWRMINFLRYRQLKKFERKVFGTLQKNITIEVVSDALKQYLLEQFDTKATITIATEDTVKPHSPTNISQWRVATRTELNIPTDATVYCYAGSAKPWQCPQETVSYFKAVLKTDPRARLLILSQDHKQFKSLLTALPQESYIITSVPHQDIHRYLAAADCGLLLREADVINWVSRPTKVLEYRSVGLSVIHNDTVKWLCEE